ncbi:MAG: folate-binding protein, partial [Cyanothece sp. SIO1E1]|nr:folate-binding protein [Cyanothece sp. SIO1E1]
MLKELRILQTAAGATFTVTAGIEVPASFDNDSAALQATQAGVAVCDRSHWGRIEVADADSLRFLHNQTTNEFQSLQPGEGCDAVFVTSTGRTIDLVTAYVTETSVLLLTSPWQQQKLIDWMDRYIFFADQVQLADVTGKTAAFTLLGPESEAVLAKLGVAALAGKPHANHQLINLAGVEARVAVGSGLAIAGYTLMVKADQAASLWQVL